MKRCWFGFFLLIGLLALSIAATVWMTRSHAQVERALIWAAEEAMAGDWEAADSHFIRAKGAWKKSEQLRACLADHTPVEEADAAFAAAQVYGAAREAVAFAAACRQLARQTAAVGEAHALVWWNLL